MSRQHHPKSHIDIRYRWTVYVIMREYLYVRFLNFYIKHRPAVNLALVATSSCGNIGQLILVFFTPVYTAHCVIPTAKPANDMQRG